MNENREGELFDGESEILKQLEQAYLTAYPNPERIGCPSPVIIEHIVSGQIRPPAASDIVRHLTHCSPCFKLFLDARDRIRSHGRKTFVATSRAGMAAIFALFVLGAGALVLWQRSRSTPAPTSTDITISQPPDRITSIHVDLQSYSLERGGSGPDRAANMIGPTLP